MQEYRTGNAVIRIHGEPDIEKIKKATVIFMKQKEEQKKRGELLKGVK